MFGSSILDLAIGMAFIYLLLSLIASTIQEAISSLVQARSANLEHGIRSLFSGGTLADGTPLVELLYTHGLVRGLYRDPALDLPKRFHFVPKLSPVRALLRRLFRIYPSPPIPGVSDPFLLPAYIPARTFAMTMIDILNPDKQNGKQPLLNIEQHLIALCDQVKATDPDTTHTAAQAMLALLADANTAKDAADKFRCNLENWYNDAMDRVSGWYKNYTQKILIAIGLVLAVAFNVDSIHLGKTLWFDKDARQGLISAAGTYVEKNTPPTGPQTGLSEADLQKHMRATVGAFNQVSAEFLLPVGWHNPIDHYWEVVQHPHRENFLNVLERVPGWLITALALSFGAPFWFDTLNKFMVVRSTVKPQEKSRNESSKDG